MNKTKLEIQIPNYPISSHEVARQDEGFIKNHVEKNYSTTLKEIMKRVRRAVVKLDVYPQVSTDLAVSSGQSEFYTLALDTEQKTIMAMFGWNANVLEPRVLQGVTALLSRFDASVASARGEFYGDTEQETLACNIVLDTIRHLLLDLDMLCEGTIETFMTHVDIRLVAKHQAGIQVVETHGLRQVVEEEILISYQFPKHLTGAL